MDSRALGEEKVEDGDEDGCVCVWPRNLGMWRWSESDFDQQNAVDLSEVLVMFKHRLWMMIP